MTLIESFSRVSSLHYQKGYENLARHFIRISGLDFLPHEIETNAPVKSAAIFLFSGETDLPDVNQSGERPGLTLFSNGSGFLQLSGPEFVLSFAHYLFDDQPYIEFLEDGVHVPFVPAFKELRTAYDYFLTQEGRVTQGLNKESYFDALARAGVTHVEVNGLGFPMALESGPKGETYPIFYTHCPAMDQFVYSSLNKGIYPFYYLSRNLANLKENAAMAVDRGLKPGMMSFEPRSVPEELFNRYPMLRGARVDHPFRSFKPRYNLTITHPMVLNHYDEMMQKLLTEIPELSFFTVWTNDSGAGFEHTKSLYVGRNGGAYLVREWKDDKEIARLAGENALNFFRTLLDAARQINPEFRVITRLESFYGEIETMWPGFRDGLEVETNSLVAHGWAMPYKHVSYPDSGVLNGGSLHHQDLDKGEKLKNEELKSRDSGASFYFGMGPEVMFAPLMGIPYPKSVWNRLKNLKSADIEQVVVYGGTFPPEQVPWFINYEMVRHFQYDQQADPDELIRWFAQQWTGGQGADALVKAWGLIEEAALNFPNVSTLYNTIGFTWYRLWTRPLVPDIEAIPEAERAYYQDMMCTTPHNPNNIDLSRDVLFQIANIEHCSKAVAQIDERVIPLLSEAIRVLFDACGKHTEGVLYDQMIRAKALFAYLLTHRNVAAWIKGVYGYQSGSNPEEKAQHIRELQFMIDLEISNMGDLQDLLDSGVNFMSLMENGETPLMYGKEIRQQIEIKQELMQTYRHLEPRIDPDYIIRKSAELL